MKIENNNNNYKRNIKFTGELYPVVANGKGLGADFYAMLKDIAKEKGEGTIVFVDDLFFDSELHKFFRQGTFNFFKGGLNSVEKLAIKEQVVARRGADADKFVNSLDQVKTLSDYKQLIIKQFKETKF